MNDDPHARVQRSFDAQGLMATLGARLQHVQPGEVRIALPFSAHLSQQMGFLHAGAITSIVDSACGYAALTQAPAGMEVVTAEFKINLMRPGIGDHFLAISKVQSAGRLLTVCTGEVRAYQNASWTGSPESPHKLIALMQATIVNVAA
jgi:uncharacterized protein (TIGR00369 family)